MKLGFVGKRFGILGVNWRWFGKTGAAFWLLNGKGILGLASKAVFRLFIGGALIFGDSIDGNDDFWSLYNLLLYLLALKGGLTVL